MTEPPPNASISIWSPEAAERSLLVSVRSTETLYEPGSRPVNDAEPVASAVDSHRVVDPLRTSVTSAPGTRPVHPSRCSIIESSGDVITARVTVARCTAPPPVVSTGTPVGVRASLLAQAAKTTTSTSAKRPEWSVKSSLDRSASVGHRRLARKGVDTQGTAKGYRCSSRRTRRTTRPEVVLITHVLALGLTRARPEKSRWVVQARSRASSDSS